MKKHIIHYLGLASVLFALTACNKDWKEEQYEHYVSFATTLDYTTGVTTVYVPYREDGKTTYEIPLVVSGSTVPDVDFDVKVRVDKDTLALINDDHFKQRTDLYYKVLPESIYSLGESVAHFTAGSYQTTLTVNFDFNGIDMSEKWVLPLAIDDTDSPFRAHPRKDYDKAILRIIPFNDYTGTYNATPMKVAIGDIPINQGVSVEKRTAYLVGENTLFFYAGLTEEANKTEIRNKYKVFVEFGEDEFGDGSGKLRLYSDEPNLHFQANSAVQKYTITDVQDAVHPYLIRRTITLNMDYYYDDFTTYPGQVLRYHAQGSMTMERRINTQIPDEDQAIEW